jgi:hypothetical protein
MEQELAKTVAWYSSWAVALPLIVFCTLVHVAGLGAISDRVTRAMRERSASPRRLMTRFVVTMSVTVFAVTLLHGLEGVIWALAFRCLGAVPDNRTAMLYSINAITSYGHESLDLAIHWQMLGALEALNGVLLFGLTTAFLFAMIQQVWPHMPQER